MASVTSSDINDFLTALTEDPARVGGYIRILVEIGTGLIEVHLTIQTGAPLVHIQLTSQTTMVLMTSMEGSKIKFRSIGDPVKLELAIGMI